MRMSAKHAKMHKLFVDLSRPFNATRVYEAMGKLVGLTPDNIDRGLGQLFREGKLKSEEKTPKHSKPSRRENPDDFR